MNNLRLLIGLAIGVGFASAMADEPQVVITGGADATGQIFRWTISNEHRVPISYVEIPHYGAVSVEAPNGWNGDLTARGGEGGRRGKLMAKAEFPWARIPQGGSAVFSMHLPEAGRARGVRDALVRFQDGAEIRVSLEVPLKETVGQRNVPLIALGAIFGLYVIVQALRRRSRRQGSGLVAPEAGAGARS